MAISKKQAKLEQRVMCEKEKQLQRVAKESGNVYLNIIMRDSVRQIKCFNETVESMTENEFIEHIRTNFYTYIQFCPSYSTIKDGLTRHLSECPCQYHWFFETEPICMSGIKNSEGTSKLISDLLDIYRYIEHLPKKKKQEFIQDNVFNLQTFDVDTIRFNLSRPNFENCLTRLEDFLEVNGTKLMKELSLNYFKSRLTTHFIKCKGPCILNGFGFPIGKKSRR